MELDQLAHASAKKTGRKNVANRATRARALEIAKANPGMKAPRIAERLSVSTRQVQYWLTGISRIAAMRATGKTDDEIVTELTALEIDESQVRRQLQRLDVRDLLREGHGRDVAQKVSGIQRREAWDQSEYAVLVDRIVQERPWLYPRQILELLPLDGAGKRPSIVWVQHRAARAKTELSAATVEAEPVAITPTDPSAQRRLDELAEAMTTAAQRYLECLEAGQGKPRKDAIVQARCIGSSARIQVDITREPSDRSVDW